MVEAVFDRFRHPLRHAAQDTFWALQDVNFAVDPGEAVGIIGRNGAGKSTLLKILSRITEPSVGEVRIAGRVGCLLEVGTGFHPELTGRENIYLNGAILGMKRSEITRHYDGIVEFSGIEKFLDTPVKRYSSGMSVRLAFAVAAHLEPEILVVDEVLAVGDAEFQKKCLGKMSEVATTDARTVLFVSHNMAAVEALCRRTIHLEAGRVVFDGPTPDAIDHYLSSRDLHESTVSGEFDLRDRHRDVQHTNILQKVTLVSEGRTSDTVRMGQGLQVLVDMLGYRDVPFQLLSVSILSSLQQKLTTAATFMKPGRVPTDREARERVVIDLDRLTLGPGHYTLTIGVWSWGRGSFDMVEDAAAFTVMSSDVLGSGYAFEPGEVMVYSDFEWHVEPSPAVEPPSGTDPRRVVTARGDM